MAAGQWKVRSILVQDQSDWQNLADHFFHGWEPFAVTGETGAFTYHLKVFVKDE